MKKLSQAKKTSPLLLLGGAALLTLAAFPQFQAFAGPEAPESFSGESPEGRENLERALLINETYEGKIRLVEISNLLRMPAAEVAAFFREEAKAGLPKENVQAWVKLIRGVSVDRQRDDLTTTDLESADVLSDTLNAMIRLRKSGVAGSFHVTEIDLADMQQSWTLPQRSNFTRVLRRAAELAKSNSVATAEDAFEQALSELGYLEAYRKGCRR